MGAPSLGRRQGVGPVFEVNGLALAPCTPFKPLFRMWCTAVSSRREASSPPSPSATLTVLRFALTAFWQLCVHFARHLRGTCRNVREADVSCVGPFWSVLERSGWRGGAALPCPSWPGCLPAGPGGPGAELGGLAPSGQGRAPPRLANTPALPSPVRLGWVSEWPCWHMGMPQTPARLQEAVR